MSDQNPSQPDDSQVPEGQQSETPSAPPPDQVPTSEPEGAASAPPPAGEYPPPPPPQGPPAGAGAPPAGGYPPPPPPGPPQGPGYPPPPPGAPPAGGYPPPPPPGPPAGGFPPPAGGYPPPPPPGGYGYPPPGGPAYPAGGYGAAPAPTFSAGDAIGYGWNGFKNNIGPLAIIALVVLAANIVTGWLQRGSDSFVLTGIMSLVSAFISLVISLGLIRAALAILDGERPEIGDLLSTRDIVPYIVASLLVAIVVGIGLLLCIIPGLIAGFLLQFYGYAIIDKRVDAEHMAPQSDPIGAMRASYEITSRNVGNLIVLAILCILLNIVGALLCGIGLLVTLPVTAIAVAYAWRYFSRGRIAPQPA
jgi:uncharacterized membrane protein